VKRVLIAGTHSGCGKTTITCAILSALKNRGLPLAAFKCGPDYIDPMFHRSALGVPARNLDPFFMDPERLRLHLSAPFFHHNRADGVSVIEGVMGYYDGIAMTSEASTFTVAAATGTPVVLTVDAAGMGNSIAAVIEGFLRHRENSRIEGVIFNGVSPAAYPYYRSLAEQAGVKAFGFMPRNADWRIESRHLGLTTAVEIPGIEEKLAAMGKQAEESLDLEGLLALAAAARDLPVAETLAVDSSLVPSGGQAPLVKAPRLAVARDEAFCFIYEENLALFTALGCEPVFFSPLRDRALPEGIDGLYLPGGYPELYAQALSENTAMRYAVRDAVGGGIPAIAECGGFLYLHETLDGFPMAGCLSAAAFRTEKLRRFGYLTLTAQADNLLCPAGGSIRAHEFHYWESSSPGKDFTGRRPGGGVEYPCVHGTDTLYAGFPHLYLPANPAFAVRFVEKMRK
jgi:cobyrinic acid a,c-diamide synthase